jgi:pyruvate,water dikinase
VQARPETVFSQKSSIKNNFLSYALNDNSPVPILSGAAIGSKIVTGKAVVITDISEQNLVKESSILVTPMTDPDWVVVMKRVAGIITNQGGRTCHAAIVSRELGVCAIVGTHDATQKIKTGDMITLDCSNGQVGIVYRGSLPFKTNAIQFDPNKKLPVKLMVNCGQPDAALAMASLPVLGVGLARLEFIIAQEVAIHPMAFVQPEKITDQATRERIQSLISEYSSSKDYFVETVARNISLIAAAFYPRDVIVRFSDFKTNEYRGLIGGEFFEPHEENPMIGLRGAFRYCHPIYQGAFVLECAALKKARSDFGMTNIHCMVPFVRSPKEAELVCELIDKNGLSQSSGCKRFMMCELPGNVMMLEKYAPFFDGFSIGSNDLSQLALGIDRDSGYFGQFDERDEAVVALLSLAIQKAKSVQKPISICGQAPSDFPEIAERLIKEGIDAISLNADTVMTFISNMS